MEDLSPEHVATLGLVYHRKHSKRDLEIAGVYNEALELVGYGMLDTGRGEGEHWFYMTPKGQRYIDLLIEYEIQSGAASGEEAGT